MTEPAPTIGIEHNGVRKDFVLAPDENDGFQWFEGLVEPIIPQEASGGFGYHAQPFKVNTPITFENWSGGCGLDFEEPGTFTTTKYSYTRGVDLSWGRRGYLSPERQASTDLTADWVRVAYTSIGVFVLVADEVWEWDSGTSAFVSRVSGAGTTPTDIVEFEGNVYVAMGDSNDYQYSSDGTLWTASTLTVKRFDQFAVRSGQDGSARLWGILSTGVLRQNDDGTNGGTEWSAATQIGDTWETLRQMVAGADFLYVFKEEGIYSFDGLLVEDVLPARTLARPNSGKQALLWIDGYIYVNYGNILWQFDPSDRTMRQVFPVINRVGHPEINGTITALTGDEEHLYFALKNAAGNTYFIKGKPSYRDDEDSEWHTWAYNGSNDCNVMSAQRAGAIDSGNPVILFDYEDVAGWFILPGEGLRPEDDASYRYVSSGTAHGSWVDGGTLLNSKLMSAGRILLERGNVNRYVTLAAQYGGSQVGGVIAQSEHTGMTVGVPPKSVRFTRLRYKATFVTDVSTDTPALSGIAFDVTPALMKHREWAFVVDLGDFQMKPGGGLTNEDPHELHDHLFATTGQETLLYDRRGRRFVCMIDDVRTGSIQATGLKDRETYIVRAFEIGVQGYLSKWYNRGTKFALPDMPDGGVGTNTDTELPEDEDNTVETLVLRPKSNTDYAYWRTSDQHHSYIRFPDAAIQPGSTIVSAHLRLRLFNVQDADLDIDLYLEDADDGTAPTTNTNAENLSLTTATTRWQVDDPTTADFDSWFESADISEAVQEVLDRAGFAAGNALTVIGRHRAVTGDAFSQWYDYELVFGRGIPELVITYRLP